MSYRLPPQVIRATAPTATDDSSKGFVVGSAWVDTSATPDALYLCTASTVGAATWINAGGVTAHTGLTTLGWSAAGHTGTGNSVAAFNGVGAAQTVQATVEGSVLTLTGGVLAFVAMAATAVVTPNSAKTIDVEYGIVLNPYGLDAASGPGAFV